MIIYQYDQEKLVALFFAKHLKDSKAESILISGEVESIEDAIHLSKFFWKMVDESASNNNLDLPCEGGPEYWLEKLYNSIGGYLEQAGYQQEWNNEIDTA